MQKIRVASVLVLAALASLAAGCGGSSSNSGGFRVGLEAPLSGEQAVLGKGMLKGAELAATKLNASDGILGKQVEVVPIDDAADPATGVKAAKSAIAEGLDGIVGPYNSGVGVETLPLYIKAGLVPIRLTSDQSTNGLGFTLQPMTYQIAPVASQALTEWQGAKSVAIAYDPTPNYTVSVSKALKALAGKGGRHGHGLREGPARQEDLHRRGRQARRDRTRRHLRRRLLPRGRPDRQGDAARATSRRSASPTTPPTTPASSKPRASRRRGRARWSACRRRTSSPAPPPGRRIRRRIRPGAGHLEPLHLRLAQLPRRRREEGRRNRPGKLTKALDAVRGWKGWTGSVTIDPSNGNRQPATVVIVDTDKKGQLHVDEDWAKAVGAPYTG